MEIKDYAQMDDRALVRLVVEGDSRAFEPLFMRHKDIIYAIRFSDTILTEPIGMPEGTPSYVNAVAVGMTSLSIDELRNEIKRIERVIGRDEFDMQRGKIHIDIDIMQYGEEKYKPNDWTREYNIRLLSQIIKG